MNIMSDYEINIFQNSNVSKCHSSRMLVSYLSYAELGDLYEVTFSRISKKVGKMF